MGKCELCGEEMPRGEEMFNYHGYSGPCPKPKASAGVTFFPHQQRVVDEQRELEEKAKKLSEFIGNNPMFQTLDPAEQERMKEQCEIMWQYFEILGKRIAAFTA